MTTSNQTGSRAAGARGERGLTLRSLVICLVALLVMGIWIEYEELYNNYGGPLAENSPPNSAVGVILAVLGIGTLLYWIRRPLGLLKAELVVIYSALVLAAPLMTQGMWHRVFGLLAAIPHNQDFKSYESLPPMLWPHGRNLVANGQFERQLDGFTLQGGTVEWEEIDRGTRGLWKSPVLVADPTASNAQVTLSVTLPRFTPDVEQLVPGESFLVSALVRTKGFTKGSSYFIKMRADDGPEQPLLINNTETAPSFANPGGFARVGVNPVTIPTGLRERLTLVIGLEGSGTLAVQDVEFLSMEAVEAAYTGRQIVRRSRLGALPANERNSTVVRPDRLWSLAGLRHLFTGYIPLGQWVRPALAWTALIGGLFLGFLGLNVLMRKQWVENERFTFPLTILPKNLFATETDARGREFRPIFRNRVMWIGFAVTFVLALLKGLQFYYPGVPALTTINVNFGTYFTSPILKAFFTNIGIGTGGTGTGLTFCLLAICLLIETDILFSLWSLFILFQLWFMVGQIFGLQRYAGYPWESQQAMGAFIAYALIAVVVGRQHLASALRSAFRRGTPADAAGEREVVSYRGALLLLGASLATLVVWGMWTRMGALASLLFFGYMLVCGFAASKIRAECGAPFAYLTPYFGMQFVAAVGGFAVFKSTGMLVATIGAGFMCTSCFLLIAPAQVEMMELGRHFSVRPRDVGVGLTLGLLGGLFVGGFVVLAWAYGFGANNLKTAWPYEQNWYFNSYRTAESNADRGLAGGAAVAAKPESRPLDVIHNPDARGLGIGAGVTSILAFIRAKFVGFPFHPIGYVLASSYFMKGMWFLLFLAWVARLVLFRIGGARMIRHGLVPFCVGMFLACIASILVFDGVGILLRLQGVTDVYSKLP
jgi:hypothetical protein